MLGDMTCDSDGRINRFIEGDGTSETLMLHGLEEANPITWRDSWWVLTRKYWVICITCSVIRMRFTWTWMNANELVLETVIEGDSIGAVLEYVCYQTSRSTCQHRATGRWIG